MNAAVDPYPHFLEQHSVTMSGHHDNQGLPTTLPTVLNYGDYRGSPAHEDRQCVVLSEQDRES